MKTISMLPLDAASGAIERALTRLGDTAKARHSYVVVEEESTKRFVQFYGSREEGLFADLPMASLGGSDPVDGRCAATAASEIFLRPWDDSGKITEGDPGAYPGSYQRKLASAADGAELALMVMKRVHVTETDTVILIWEDECGYGPS